MDTNYPACTPREGYPVEIQALWISALKFLGRNELAAKAILYGMRPLRDDGLMAIFNGETTVDEVVRYT
jgi:hypothetical protein